ncbi:MAG: DUF3396 domain-containing protein [Azoarcus sp.]|jgi:hypothetical protein|nr:DUF3396 domain-containing protein [Azoarcus sp.]
MLTKEQIQGYASLDRLGVVYGKNGFAAGQIALGAELYVAPRERSRLRLDMLDVQEDYYSRFKERLDLVLFYSKEKSDGLTERRLKGKDSPFPFVREATKQRPLEEAYQIGVFGDPSHPDFPDKGKYEIPSWSSTCFIRSGDSKRMSYQKFSLPVSDGNGGLHFDILRDCVLAWAKILRPAHGLAGLTLLQENSSLPGLYPTLQKYPGLDIQAALDFSMEAEGTHDRIKCVNWLTVLGEALAEDLGGEFVLRNALEPECTLYTYPGGILIQAGEAPRLADVAVPGNDELLAPYRKVAFITRRVRFMDYEDNLFRVEEPLNGAKEAKKWASRFD